MNFPSLGLDISKAFFHACLLHNSKLRHKKFPNDSSGFLLLQNWLSRSGCHRVQACMEATASYGDQLAHFLHNAGHRVSIVNPARIKGFALSQMARNKTDKLDSTIIARFCDSQHPEEWTPPPVEIEQLQALVRRVESLSQMRQQESNRLDQPSKNETVRQSLEKVIGLLDTEIENLRKQIKDEIDQNPRLKSDRELLLTIPGIGETTVAWLLSEVMVEKYASARQLAAHAGLTPRQNQSGTSVRGRSQLSKTGNARLRKALYMPAIVAKRYNRLIKDFCDRLKERGKRPMEIICAAMRKLLHIVYGVLKSGKAFDPSLAP